MTTTPTTRPLWLLVPWDTFLRRWWYHLRRQDYPVDCHTYNKVSFVIDVRFIWTPFVTFFPGADCRAYDEVS